MTGQSVNPQLYIAFGISGSMQHIIGMKDSRCIIAINKDPNAPIFNYSHYGIVDNIDIFLPVLLETLKSSS